MPFSTDRLQNFNLAKLELSMIDEKPQAHSNPMLMGVSIGGGMGLASAASKAIDSWLLSSVAAGLIAGVTAYVIYRAGLWLTASKDGTQ